jgi:hypothetical protein
MRSERRCSNGSMEPVLFAEDPQFWSETLRCEGAAAGAR